MKNTLPTLLITGSMVGLMIGNRLPQPQYLTVTFEPDNQYVATVSAVIEQVQAKEEQATPSATPGLTSQTTDQKAEELVQFIWNAESSRGKAGFEGSLQKYCEDKGMWNETGYGGMALKHCFKDKNEGWTQTTHWVKRHLEEFGGDIAKTLCHYNLGGNEINCKYYQKYLGAL